MRRNTFIEAAVFKQPPSDVPDTGWADTSTNERLQFTAPCGYVSIARRQAYPHTFAFVKGDVLFCGYGRADDVERIISPPLSHLPESTFYDDEFLYIALDCRQQTLTIQTDAYGSVAIFVGSQDDRCIVSTDFARTVELLNPQARSLDIDCVVQYLLSQMTFERTFVKEIQLLYDRKRFYWSPRQPKLWLPPDAEMRDYHNNRTGDARQFPQQLEQTLDRYWQRYVNGDPTACELSCGLDSSTVAAYLARNNYRPLTITSVFPGTFGHTQTQKLRDFTTRFNIQAITLPAEEYLDYPWMEVLLGRTSQPFYHYAASPYSTSFDNLYMTLAQQGATSMFTGVGGDELFEHVDHRRVMSNTSHGTQQFASLPAFAPLVSYATELEAKKDFRHTTQPIPLRSHTTMIVAAAGDNDSLRYGLWPISPLADPRLYAYMQTLPLHFLVDKLLLRMYADLLHVPKSITIPHVNEDFRYVQVQVFQKLKDVVAYMLDQSLFVERQLINKKLVLKMYRELVSDPQSGDFATALLFGRILRTELNLRSLRIHSF